MSAWGRRAGGDERRRVPRWFAVGGKGSIRRFSPAWPGFLSPGSFAVVPASFAVCLDAGAVRGCARRGSASPPPASIAFHVCSLAAPLRHAHSPDVRSHAQYSRCPCRLTLGRCSRRVCTIGGCSSGRSSGGGGSLAPLVFMRPCYTHSSALYSSYCVVEEAPPRWRRAPERRKRHAPRRRKPAAEWKCTSTPAATCAAAIAAAAVYAAVATKKRGGGPCARTLQRECACERARARRPACGPQL